VQKLGFDIEATAGDARAGVVHLPNGSFKTPVFMPVGTRGVVRSLTAADVAGLGAEIILGNTYHLMMRPGAELVEEMGGLHEFSGWKGRMLTDSGGFQVFSLNPKVDDDGVNFSSVYDGSKHRFTPEDAVRVQEQLGADIAMVLDVCPPLPSPPHWKEPRRGRPVSAKSTKDPIRCSLASYREESMRLCAENLRLVR
jgi:queuine tRNA-ribosyltransferase